MGKAKSYEEYISNRNKKNDEENKPSSKAKSYEEYLTRRDITSDILYKDSESLNNSIVSMIDGWQDSKTMEKNRSDISSMMQRLSSVKNYATNYRDSFDNSDDYDNYIKTTDDLINYYQKVLDNFDGYSELYGKYKSSDDYEKAMQENEQAIKLREEMSAFDLDSGKAELEGLKNTKSDVEKLEAEKQGIINQYKNKIHRGGGYTRKQGESYDDFINRIVSNDSRIKKIDEQIASLGGDSKTLGDTISQKTQYYNEAKNLQENEAMTNEAINAEDFEEYAKVGADKGGIYRYGVSWTSNAPAMNDDEHKIYNYYLGKYGYDKAEAYKKTIDETLNYRSAEKAFENLEDNTALELVSGISAGLEQFSSGISNLFNFKDDYIPLSSSQMVSSMVREDLADDGFSVLGNSLGQSAYDLITTTFNMVPSIAVSSSIGVFNPVAGEIVGATLMGSSAAGNAYQEMLNLGYDKSQARVYSALTGASEAGLQYILGGIGKLGGKLSGKLAGKVGEKIASQINNAYIKFAVQHGTEFLAKMGSEGLEEFLQDVLDPYFKAIATGETPEDIDWEQAVYSGLLGSLSAGFIDGGSAVVNRVSGLNAASQIKKDGNINTIKEIGSTYDPKSLAYEMAQGLTDKTGKWKIADTMTALKEELGTQNKADIKKALMKKGISEVEAERYSKLFDKAFNGGTLTKSQQKEIFENSTLTHVFKSLTSKDSVLSKRNQAFSKLGVNSGSFGTDFETINKTNTTEAINEDINAEIKLRNLAVEYAKRKFGVGNGDIISRQTDAMIDSMVEDAVEQFGEKSVSENRGISTDINVDDRISDDGKTTLASTGEEVSIKEIASIEDGKMQFRLNDGTIVDSADINYSSEEEALTYETILNLGVSSTIGNNIIKSAKKSNIPTDVFMQNVMLAYDYGITNESSRLGSIALPKNIRNFMFQTGREYAQKHSKEMLAKSQSRVVKGKASNKVTYVNKINGKLNEKQKAMIHVAEFYAKTTSLDINVFQSYRKGVNVYANINGVERETSANGWFVEGTNKIYIDINAGGNFDGLGLFTLAHESGHFIRSWNATEWQTMADVIVDIIDKQAKADSSNPTFEEMLAKKYNKYQQYKKNEEALIKEGKISKEQADYAGRSDSKLRDMAYEDVICDSLESLMADKETFVEFANKLDKKDHKLWVKLKEFIKNFLDKLDVWLKSYSGINTEDEAGRSIQNAIKEDRDRIRELYVSAFIGANENYNKAVEKNALGEEPSNKATQKNTADEGGVKNSQREKIYPNMPDSERADIIRNTTIDVVEFKDDKAELSGKHVLKLKSTYKSEAQKILKALAEKFGVFKDYSNDSIELVFNYSRGSLNESVHKQNERNADFYDFAKMLYIFDDVVANAQAIETHTDKYTETKRENQNLKQVYVLMSAFKDGEYVVPVEFNIKEFEDNTQNQLYVSVTLQKMKADLMGTPSEINSYRIPKPTFTYSLSKIIENVNPTDEEFLKYIPDELLSDEQKQGKSNAIKREKLRIDDLKYEHAAKNNPEKAREMLKEAAKRNGYSNDTDWRMDHKAPNADDETAHNIAELDKAYGGDGSLYSPQAVYYYGEGRSYDSKAIQIIRSVRNKPNAMVKIYRAVPTSIKDTRVRNGDWVAIVKDYAVEHAERILDGKYRIIENTVPAKFLFNNGDSINEFGYDNGNRNEVYKNTAANVKLDEITYDDSGNLIPLSERFNAENSDIRYSERDYPIDADVENTVKNAYAKPKGKMHELSVITSEQNKSINRLVNQNRDDSYRGKYEGGKHRFSDTAIRHIISEHGDFLREGLRAQLPMTLADVARHLSAIKDNKKPSSIKATRTKQGNPSILTSYEVNGYTLYAEEITKPLGRNLPNDLIGHTMYKAPTLSTAAALATSARALPRRQSEVLCKYYMPNSTDLSTGNFISDNNGNPALLSFVSKNNSPTADVLLGGLIALSSDSANLTDKSGQVNHGYVRCKKPFYITRDNRVFSNSETDIAKKIEELKNQGYDCFIFDKTVGDNYMVAVVNKAQIVKDKPEMLFSDRNLDMDNRTLLSNALASTAQNEIEKKYIEQYQEKIESINEEQKKLTELRAKIKELSFAKGHRDLDQIRKLRDEATKTANRINTFDKQLLKLESAKPLKEVLNREKALAKKKAEKAGREALDAYKERAAEAQRELMNRYTERIKKGKERRDMTELRHKIRRIADDFKQRLLNGSNTRYVPKNLVEGIISVCNEIDPTGKDQNTKVAEKYRSGKASLAVLRMEYDSLKEEDYEFASEFNEEFSNNIKELSESVGDTPLRDMSKDQLEEVYNIIHDIKVMLTDATKQIGTAEKISNYEAGQEIIALMHSVKGLGLTTNKVSSEFRNWMENPMRAVREMSAFDPDSRLLKLFNALNEGRRKMDTFRMESNKEFDKLRSTKEGEKNFNDAVEKAYDFGLTDVNGESLKISKMQAMQLVLTYNREQANKNRKHLQTGAVIPDVDLQRKGKFKEAFDNGQKIGMVTPEVITKIMDGLSEWDKQYLELARKFFNGKAKSAVNETSMITKHRIIATEKEYIPYEVNEDYISKDSDNVKFDGTIEGIGMLKSVKENASQMLVMSGLNSILSDHIDNVAKLYGLSVPIRNWNKVFNMMQTANDGGISVKEAIRETWKDAGVNLLDQAVADLQTPRRHDSVKLLSTIKSAQVASTLASNISVWMKQAASYPTAGAVLSQKALTKGLIDYVTKIKDGIHAQDVWDEIDAHTSQHWIRRQGLSMQELGDFNQSKGWLNKVNKKLGKASPMNWIQAMDVATTAALWYACKSEVDSTGVSKGSDEYWEAVTELYDKVIEETQPMYDSLHRAEITKKDLLKNFIMFQTQPLQNSGILREGAMEYKMAKKQYGKDSKVTKQAGKKFRMAVGSQMASHFVFTAMTLIAGMLLHKMNPWRDDDDELTAESVAENFAIQFSKNYFNAIVPIIGNYATSLCEVLIGGSRNEVITDFTVDRINTTINTFAKLKEPTFENFANAFCEVASYFGIPASNAKNIVNGIILHAQDAINGEFLSFEAGVDRTTGQEVDRMYSAYENGDTTKMKSIFNELIQEKIDSGKTEKEAKSAVKTSITSKFKPVFLEAYHNKDNTTMAQIRKFLNATGIYDDVVKTTQNWIKQSK